MSAHIVPFSVSPLHTFARKVERGRGAEEMSIAEYMFTDERLTEGLRARQDDQVELGDSLHGLLELPQDEMADADELPREPLASSQELALDSIQSYLNEIGRVALLSATEEVELAE